MDLPAMRPPALERGASGCSPAGADLGHVTTWSVLRVTSTSSSTCTFFETSHPPASRARFQLAPNSSRSNSVVAENPHFPGSGSGLGRRGYFPQNRGLRRWLSMVVQQQLSFVNGRPQGISGFAVVPCRAFRRLPNARVRLHDVLKDRHAVPILARQQPPPPDH